MELTHTFTVPASIETTWSAFNDIESVAGCFPGAVVTGVDGDDFTGTCKVKLGPVAMVYNGTGTFVEKNEEAKRFVVNAKGKDKRGNGTAGALVTATMTDVGGATEVNVLTELTITGKPAQFGRGVIEDISNKLLGQFVACLEKTVNDGPPEAAEVLTDAAAPVPDDGAGAAGPAAADETATSSDPVASSAASGSAAPAAPTPIRPVPNRQHTADDSLDLGATVLPILARTYGAQALAGLGLLALLIWWIRRD